MIDYEEYFQECWEDMPESVITDEYWEKNKELFQAITYELYQYHYNCGALPPQMACIILQKVFTNMISYGIR